MPTQVNPGKKEGGGGLLGAIGSFLGLVAGAVLAPVTGGASLGGAIAATAGGAAAGAGIGGTVGGLADMVVDPKHPDEQISGPSAAMERRAAQLNDPSIKSSDSSAILKDSLAELEKSSIPQELKAEYAPILTQAYEMSQKQRQKGKGVGVIS